MAKGEFLNELVLEMYRTLGAAFAASTNVRESYWFPLVKIFLKGFALHRSRGRRLPK
jgi:hypothetical protein